MTIINASDQTVEQIVRDHRKVLIDFWAPWCGPCRMIAPTLEQLDTELGDQVVIAKVNVDANPYAAIKFAIQGIPTLKLFVDGTERETIVGAQPLSRLKQMIMKY